MCHYWYLLLRAVIIIVYHSLIMHSGVLVQIVFLNRGIYLWSQGVYHENIKWGYIGGGRVERYNSVIYVCLGIQVLVISNWRKMFNCSNGVL